VVEVYDEVEAYEVAFSYRDVPAEVDVLTAWYHRHTTGRLERALELAAGPGDHALELARRGLTVTALDLNASMCRRAAARARLERLNVSVACADMTAFAVEDSFDLVLLMLDSAAHLLTLDDFISMLMATARHTRVGGLLICEMSHPADFLTLDVRTNTEWETTRGDLTVRLRWGTASDDFDPTTQVQQTQVRLETCRAGQQPQVREEVVAERRWTATEVEAAVRLSGEWETVARYGALSIDQPFDNDDSSWRMIHILRRCRCATHK
jgi:SAM-dependent methyltransferase